MKVTCGTDIVEVDRIQDSIEQMQEKFLNKIYTEKEITYCEKSKAHKFEHYAARFAAKEAVFKALSEYIDNYSLDWKEVEILNNEKGRPYVNLKKEITQIEQIDISLSHIKECAIAVAVVVSKGDENLM